LIFIVQKHLEVIKLASKEGYNLRVLPIGSDIENAKGFGVTFDELTCDDEIDKLYQILAKVKGKNVNDLLLQLIKMKF